MFKKILMKRKGNLASDASVKMIHSEKETATPKNHVCVLFCYRNLNHIKQCFESIYDDKTDYFIVENYSPESEHIKNFFFGKRLEGYIQFVDNITNNAADIFLRDFKEKLRQYKYVTFSDCDLKVHSKEALFDEIFENLDFENVLISCADLEMGNLPDIKGAENWIPESRTTEKYIEGFTGIHFLTIKGKDLGFFDNVHFLDGNLHLKCIKLKRKWVKTLRSKVYHLTWDLYFSGNDYFEYKSKNSDTLWNHTRVCDYKVIV